MNGLIIGDAVTGGLIYGLPLEPNFGLSGMGEGGRSIENMNSNETKAASKEAASSLCAAVFAHLLKVQEALGLGLGEEDRHTEKHYPDTLRALFFHHLQTTDKKKKGVTIITTPTASSATFVAARSKRSALNRDGEESSDGSTTAATPTAATLSAAGSGDDGGGLQSQAQRILLSKRNRCLVPAYSYCPHPNTSQSQPVTLHIHADPFVPVFAVVVSTTAKANAPADKISSAGTVSAFTNTSASMESSKQEMETAETMSFERNLSRGAVQVFLKAYGHNFMAAVINGRMAAATVVDQTAVLRISTPPTFTSDLSKLLKDHLPLPITSVSAKALKKAILPEIKTLYRNCVIGEFGASITRSMHSVASAYSNNLTIRMNLGLPPLLTRRTPEQAHTPDVERQGTPPPTPNQHQQLLSQEQVNRLCPLSSVCLAYLEGPVDEQKLKRPLPLPTANPTVKMMEKEAMLLENLLPRMNAMFHVYSDRTVGRGNGGGSAMCVTSEATQPSSNKEPSITNAQDLSNKRWVYVECRRAIESLATLYGQDTVAPVPRLSQLCHSSFVYRCEQCAHLEKKLMKKVAKELKKRKLFNGGVVPSKDRFATPATCHNVSIQCEPVESRRVPHPVFLARVVIVLRLQGSLVVILRLNWLVETHQPTQSVAATPIQEKIRATLGRLMNETPALGAVSQSEVSLKTHAAGERVAGHFMDREVPVWLAGLKMLFGNGIPL